MTTPSVGAADRDATGARVLPEGALGGEADHLAAFLRFHRATVVEKCRSLRAEDLLDSRVPSGWTPLGLLLHVAAMERRWVVWGFLGEQVRDPHLDTGGDDHEPWSAPDGWGLPEVVDLLSRTATRTDTVLATVPLETPAALGGRFATDPPTLRWIAFHVLQEYARHAGQLDVAIELAGGLVGE